MSDQVICRSDHDYLGYPLAFYWQGQRLEVARVLEQNRTPMGFSFRVHTMDFGIFELDYEIQADQWSVHQI